MAAVTFDLKEAYSYFEFTIVELLRVLFSNEVAPLLHIILPSEYIKLLQTTTFLRTIIIATCIYLQRNIEVPNPIAIFPNLNGLFPNPNALFPNRIALLPNRIALFPNLIALFPNQFALFPNKIEKGIVFDCAAKYQGKSINDQILTGPKLQNDIVNVMMRFRRFRYAVIGDISEMYLQILLTPKDRKFCRFIFNDKIYEWSRLIFGRSDAPFIALHVVRNHALKYKDQYGETVNSILESMYIDDLCDSRDEPSKI